MRHAKKVKTLDRERGARKALMGNLAASLIIYEKVKTTEAKAKAMRPLVERLVTRGKAKNLASKRYLDQKLPETKAVKKILEVLGPRYRQRHGGYLRIYKISPRKGDGAKMAIIEFVK